MAKINILDSSIYNRIAAGEVVDRPYSVVKEFVENSLDAGAKNITVSIERGGKDLICVTDDGAGIERSELRSAFLPHATSKISKVEDLDLIRTLGFRGEALASIASVARVRIRSRYKGSAEAFEISCAGGVIGEILPCALGEGTEICAENLFFNTPVRAKFLKTDKGEEGEISNFVSRFVLGNPNVAFRYYIDGKLSLQSFGGGLDEAVAAVYGGAVISECYRIDAVKNGVRVYGYIGKPSFSKPNRTYQSVFVNGRYVVNNTVASAISNAYGSYLMKRQYPFYVLFVDVPPEIVDVNVHPNKSDVRFENNQIIYGSIYSVVSAVLDGTSRALDFVVDVPKEGLASEPVQPFRSSMTATGSKVANNSSAELQAKQPAGISVEQSAAGSCSSVQKGPFYGDLQAKQSDGAAGKEQGGGDVQVPFPEVKNGRDQAESVAAAGVFARPTDVSRGVTFEFHDSGARSVAPEKDYFAENKRYLETLDQKAKQQKIVFECAEYRGCLFNTYLIYEEGDAAYFIDQHAAHERLIFDRLKAEMDARKVVRQPMLVPYVLRVNREEFTFIKEHIPEIDEIGFEIEEFGGESFKVSSVPLDLQSIDLASFFNELLKDVGSLRGIKLSELLRDKIATTACKHAVKGGMMLTDAEKEKLFEMLRGDMGLKCPHGRPIAVRMPKTEIEKLFKRIV